MKALALFLVLASVLVLRADNYYGDPAGEPKDYLSNGDFSDGLAHWSGVKAPSDTPEGERAQGAELKLLTDEWSMATQEITLPAGKYKLHVAFTIKPDTAFSSQIPDYIGLKDRLNIPSQNYLEAHPGQWIVALVDATDQASLFWRVSPTAKVGPQSYTFTLAGFNAANRQTLTLAFPPGKGTVVLNKVSIVAATAADK